MGKNLNANLQQEKHGINIVKNLAFKNCYIY